MAERFAAHLKDLRGPPVEKRWSKGNQSIELTAVRLSPNRETRNFSRHACDLRLMETSLDRENHVSI